MLIKCPLCGERDVEEFTYWGDATISYPDLDASEGDWFHAVCQRRNPAGNHSEFWHHENGCRSFLKVERNVTTHVISSCVLAGPFGNKGTNE